MTVTVKPPSAATLVKPVKSYVFVAGVPEPLTWPRPPVLGMSQPGGPSASARSATANCGDAAIDGAHPA